MKRILIIAFIGVAAILSGKNSQAQCLITASATPSTICNGDPVVLTSSGSCGFLMMNDFNNGTIGSGWASNASPMFNNPCPPACDGTTYLWIGPATNFPREVTTVPFDVSGGGCQISFCMKYAEQSNSSPCEGPDLPTEGVHLQYMIPGGSWVDINYWDPNGGHDPQFVNWNTYVEMVPPAAATANTQFRWYQTNTSGNGYDHWGLDNVEILCPVSQNVQWSHGPTVFNPPPIYPTQDTCFIVTILDTITGQSADDTVCVIVNPVPTANFTGPMSICTNDDATVNFSGTAGGTASYTWDFDGATIVGGGTGPGPHTLHWNSPGVYNLTLSVEENGCTSQPEDIDIIVNQSPLISFTADVFSGCQPLTVNFLDNTSPSISVYDWNFGDPASGANNQSSQGSPQHIYNDAGQYTINLIATTDSGCMDSLMIPNLITVLPQPDANFSANPQPAKLTNPVVNFTDLSINPSLYYWTITSNDPNIPWDTVLTSSSPIVTFPPIENSYTACLLVTNDNGQCIDSICKTIEVIADVLKIPNVITPNGDGFNDKLVIENIHHYPKAELIIFNRWGKIVFETTNYANDWDGENCSDGTYFYILRLNSDGVLDHKGEEKFIQEVNGTITIIGKE